MSEPRRGTPAPQPLGHPPGRDDCHRMSGDAIGALLRDFRSEGYAGSPPLRTTER